MGTIRGAGIYGGMAPDEVGMSTEEFTQALDQAGAERTAEAIRAYERAREAQDQCSEENETEGDG